MFISHTYKFILIKTRKTAGSSVEKFFIDNDKDFIFGGMPPEKMLPINCAYPVEHKGWEWIKKHYPREWNSYYKITLERNPWDKVVSLYYWQKKINEGKDVSFENYIMKRENKWNKKDWNMYTKNNNVVVDYIIQFDNINQDMHKLSDILGFNYNNELTKISLKSNIRKNNNYKDLYNTDLRDIVANSYKNVISHFNYKF